MKTALTILFSIFATWSLLGASADDKESARKNFAYCFITSVFAILAINLF